MALKHFHIACCERHSVSGYQLETSASVNNFIREPCKFYDGKKKKWADRISIAVAIEISLNRLLNLENKSKIFQSCF